MRVLIVEDEPKMARLVRRGLIEEGHAADVAARGEDALWMVQAHPYDAVVLDADGAVAVPAARVGEVLAAARERAERERVKREQLEQGALSYDLDGLRPLVEG